MQMPVSGRLSGSMAARKCLFCGTEDLNSLSLASYLMNRDVICDLCRKKFEFGVREFTVEGIRVRSIYLYNGMMKDVLLQYKEGYDEALAPVFLCGYQLRFNLSYRGYTIVPLPSSAGRIKERGFSHLEPIFAGSWNEIADILEKKEDISQKNQDYRDRKMMRDNIRIRKGAVIPERILLVDDVITSGSTVVGAYNVLCGCCRDIRVFCISYNERWVTCKGAFRWLKKNNNYEISYLILFCGALKSIMDIER